MREVPELGRAVAAAAARAAAARLLGALRGERPRGPATVLADALQRTVPLERAEFEK